jgi:hypothetical protein
MARSSRLLCLAIALPSLLAGCGLVTVRSSSSDSGPPAQCAVAVPVETTRRGERMKVVADAERARFIASAQPFKDSDNDGAFAVAAGQPLLVTRCNSDDITLYTALGRVVRMPMAQAGVRLSERPERWNVDEERSPQENSTESLLANATKEMIEEVAATNLLATRSRCLEVKLGACQAAQRAVETGPPIADLAAAATSACSTAGEKAFAECFDVRDKRWLAVLSALRTVEERADEEQKEVIRRKLQ